MIEYKFKIVAITTLRNAGIKIGKLASQRPINAKVVESKKQSLLNCGQVLPAIVVKATAALAQGLVVLDFETNEKVTPEMANDYVVLIDGNHRLTAHNSLINDSESGYTRDFFVMFPLNEEQRVTQLLAEITTCTKLWSGADYVRGAIMATKYQYPVLDYIYELTCKGYSLPSASGWANGAKLSKGYFVKIMNGGSCDKLAAKEDLPARKSLHEVVVNKLGEDMLKTRTIPDWIIEIVKKTPNNQQAGILEKLGAFFNGLSGDQVKELQNIEGKRGGETRESLMNKKLNKLYKSFSNANRNTVTV